ncbi:MAG: energy transducer TonB [Chitinivorax sp.]
MTNVALQPADRGERRGLALLLAAAMHVALLLLLIFGLQWQVKHDQPVAVELWSSLPKPSQPKTEPPPPKPQPKPKPKPQAEPEPEPEVVKKPDIALKQEKPKPKSEPKHEEKSEPPKPKEKPEPKPKEKPEPKAEEKPKPEEKPKVADKPKPVNRAAELAKLADEFSASVKPASKPGPSAAEVAAGKAKSGYGDSVRSRIERNVIWSADKPVSGKAVFEVTLLPSMEVLKVEKLSSSGNSSYDDAAERAIWKTSPFPPRPEELPFGEIRKLVLRLNPPQ